MMKILRNGRPLDISLILVATGFLGTIALIQLLRAQVNSSAQQTQRSPTQASQLSADAAWHMRPRELFVKSGRTGCRG